LPGQEPFNHPSERGSPGTPIRNPDPMQMARDPRNRRQTLLIDADDTLWENNIYFERAIVNFISFLNHREFTPGEIRQVLNEVERKSIPTMATACTASPTR